MLNVKRWTRNMEFNVELFSEINKYRCGWYKWFGYEVFYGIKGREKIFYDGLKEITIKNKIYA